MGQSRPEIKPGSMGIVEKRQMNCGLGFWQFYKCGSAGLRQRRPASRSGSTVTSELPDRETSSAVTIHSVGNVGSNTDEPRMLEEMGNSKCSRGKFEEAMVLFDRAIAIDPEEASYWMNKAAALAGMRRLLEAVEHCKEAARIDPCYLRAHHQLSTLYLRLGCPVKALHHCQLSGPFSSAKDFTKVHVLQSHLHKFTEARMRKDWNIVHREAMSAISGGADSAPQVVAALAEALLNLQRHEEADRVLKASATFDPKVADNGDLFDAPTVAYILAVEAQVHMASGRFEDAVMTVKMAVRIDPNNKEAARVAMRIHVTVSCRNRGNDLFKNSKFVEACAAYKEGLQLVAHNSVLYCNRAACRLKLGQHEEAVQDCNMALRLQPSYRRARLRRADCNTMMMKWEAARRDYLVLIQDDPDDEEVREGLDWATINLVQERKRYMS